ncbi:DNA repair protein rhp57 [Sporothrix curviconia]|uniref:DNA repair protein rhp57 n=1 Tax=Sporothrix curviconia TaxID=1260050 RepID=A0ABP0BWC9_9PEZI
MSDLHALLPDFPAVDKYAALLAGLETHRVSLSELLTLDAAEVGKRTRLPLLDLQRLCEEVRAQLAKVPARPVRPSRRRRRRPPPLAAATTEKVDGGEKEDDDETQKEDEDINGAQSTTPSGAGNRISTLDLALDAALAGGFPTGVLSEVVGESGVGKTQLLLSLLLAVQLPPPRGLGRKALYIASEAPLATSRLTQIMASHPDHELLQQHCSLQSIATINTPDLEAQEHILTHQLPVQLSKAEQYGGPGGSFGLVVLDSVAANFRPFFGGGSMGDKTGGPGEKGGGDRVTASGGRNTSLAARSLELTRLGMLLRTLAQKHNLAVVVANQVADRFDGGGGLDGNYGDGGLVSLSQQQWGHGGSIPRQISSTMASAAKRPRQAGSMLPPPSTLRQPPSSTLYHSQLTQESPLAARSRRQQQQQQPPPLPPQVPAATMSSQPETDTKPLVSIKQQPLSSSGIDEKPQLPPDAEIPLSALDFLPPSSQYIPPSQFPPLPPAPPVLQLDHQQRWFTGWGDSPSAYHHGHDGNARNKTPSLGLVWAVQLGMRVALIKASRVGGHGGHGGGSGYRPLDGSAYGGDDVDYDKSSSVDRHNTGAPRLRYSWRRWMKVVFAPHVAATGATSNAASTTASERHKSALAARMQGAVEFDITMGGLRAVVPASEAKKGA